jgi:hypothetical protein
MTPWLTPSAAYLAHGSAQDASDVGRGAHCGVIFVFLQKPVVFFQSIKTLFNR